TIGNARQKDRLTQRAFYRFRLHTRTDEPSTILRAQRLLQQLVVDAWAISDQNKLNWLWSNQAHLRTDLYNGLQDVRRAGYLKLRDLLDQIKNKSIFGYWQGWVWTIEYQKRGLPHLPLLLFLRTTPEFLTAAYIDRFISAELPTDDDPSDQQLRSIIQTTMVH